MSAVLCHARQGAFVSRLSWRKSLINNHLKLGDEGLELPPDSPEKTAISPEERAKSGARVDATADPADADLARIVTAWPGLPEYVRERILALVDEASRE